MLKFIKSHVGFNIIILVSAFFFLVDALYLDHSNCSHAEHTLNYPDSLPTTGHFCGHDAIHLKMTKQELQLQV